MKQFVSKRKVYLTVVPCFLIVRCPFRSMVGRFILQQNFHDCCFKESVNFFVVWFVLD